MKKKTVFFSIFKITYFHSSILEIIFWEKIVHKQLQVPIKWILHRAIDPLGLMLHENMQN